MFRWVATLLLLLLLLLNPTTTVVQAAKNRQPQNYVDDLYHCRDPSMATEVSCDWDTYTWNVEDLQDGQPPAFCSEDDLVLDFGVDDDKEPCVLWVMTYGGIAVDITMDVPTLEGNVTDEVTLTEEDVEAPSPATVVDELDNAPALAPTTDNPDVPNEPPVGEPGQDPGTEPAPLVEIDKTPATRSIYTIEPVLLTLIWSNMDDSDSFLSLDRAELHALTQLHVLEALQAVLGATVVPETSLLLTAGVPQSPRTWPETLSGSIVIVSKKEIPSDTLQRLVQQSFRGNALELYQFRLQIAKDPSLREVSSVVAGTDVFESSPRSPNADPNNDNGADKYDKGPLGETWSPLMIAIVASVGTAALAVGCFAYVLLFRRKSRHHNNNNSNNNNNKKNHSMPRELPVVTTNSTDEEHGQEAEEDDDMENRSLDVSLYSYMMSDDTSMISAVTGLYSIHESDATTASEADFQKRKKKGLIWSVMDSLNTHFGTDDEGSQAGGRGGLLGPSRSEDAAPYGDDSPLSYLETVAPSPERRKAMEKSGKAADEESQLEMETPVKKRFEDLWKEEDAQEEQETPSSSGIEERDALEDTLKKSNVAGKVYAPPEPLLTEFKQTLAPLAIVNHVPKKEEEEDETTKLPLPAALQEKTASTSESASVHSSHSNRSIRSTSSSRSASSREVESVRPLRVSNWGAPPWGAPPSAHDRSVRSARSTRSVHSTTSTDSAKYRSLLKQDDTNDAALFFNKDVKTTAQDDSSPSKSSESSSSAAPISSLVGTFDQAWANDNQNSLLNTSPEPTSEDEDVYTEDNPPASGDDSSSKDVSLDNSVDNSDVVDEYSVDDDSDETDMDQKETKASAQESLKSPETTEEDEPAKESSDVTKEDDDDDSSFAHVEKRLPFEDAVEPNEEEKKEEWDNAENPKSTMASF